MTELITENKVEKGISQKKILSIIFIIIFLLALGAGIVADKFKQARKRANLGREAATDVRTPDDISSAVGGKSTTTTSNNVVINNNLNPAVTAATLNQQDSYKSISNEDTKNGDYSKRFREEQSSSSYTQEAKLPPLQQGSSITNSDNSTFQSSISGIDNPNKAAIGINTQQAGTTPSNTNASADSYTAQNGQGDKLKFLQTEAQIMTDYNKATINKPLSKYEIKAGSVIPAILKTSINSDLPSQIITAVVRENVFDTVTGNYLLIPKGSTLVGRYDSNVAYGQNRLLVAWNRLIYPNGKSYNFVNGFSGADSMGRAGFEGAVDEHYWKLFGASFVMGAITGGMSYASGANNNTLNPTMGQTVAQSIGQQAAQTGLTITQKNLNIQPTIKVDAGYKFNILISSDCILGGKV